MDVGMDVGDGWMDGLTSSTTQMYLWDCSVTFLNLMEAASMPC